ncbi:MAG TPA: peptide deformylase [Bacteroidales bacterium]|nr:peptide deformylase [Bacteroidales bacterium]
MILPILSYGHDLLRQKCSIVSEGYPELDQIIDNMWETLYSANGMGLAAPQIGKKIQLFIVDSHQVYEEMSEAERIDYFSGDEGIAQTFINPVILEKSEDTWSDQESCLSIPLISEEVERSFTIRIEYFDRHLKKQTKNFSGITARIIQHEYDHLHGILFTEHLSGKTRKEISGTLNRIAGGKITVKYNMVS